MLIAAFACIAAAAPAEPLQIYVSPVGKDSATGLGAEFPLATPAAARDKIRALRAANDPSIQNGATVRFAPGRYELAEPFVLEPRDSGTTEAPIAYTADSGPVVFSGGSALAAWRGAEFNGKPVLAADVPASVPVTIDTGPAFRTIWIGEARATWARYPNAGAFARIENIPERPPGDWTVGPTSFRYLDADSPAWKQLAPECEVVTFTRWVDSHLRVSSIDSVARMARFQSPNVFSLEGGDLYHIEGAAALLDEPGEWWCDAAKRVIYFMPKPGETPPPAVVPRLDTLLQIAGKPEAAEFVHDVTFRGLTFAHARWWFPRDYKAAWPPSSPVGFVQAAHGAPAAVRADGALRVTFDQCTVQHTEAYGLELARGCRDCRITRCTITDLGAGGLKIGETTIRDKEPDQTRGNLVEDCRITDGGHIHHQAIGVWIGQSSGNRIAHNLIAEFDYTGISIGWTWGYGPSSAGGNIVELNEVKSLGDRPGNPEPPLGDMAGIYTLGTQQGTIIRQNLFRDIAGRTIGWGIYFDEGSTGIVAERNVVVRTTHGGFHQHYGRDNVVRGNIFAFGRDAQIWRTRREDHNSFSFIGNLVTGAGDNFLAGDWSDHYTADANIYWRTDGKPVVFPGGKDLPAWRAGNRDGASMTEDPGLDLSDAKRPKLAPNSPAQRIGFTPPDLSTVGPR